MSVCSWCLVCSWCIVGSWCLVCSWCFLQDNICPVYADYVRHGAYECYVFLKKMYVLFILTTGAMVRMNINMF